MSVCKDSALTPGTLVTIESVNKPYSESHFSF